MIPEAPYAVQTLENQPRIQSVIAEEKTFPRFVGLLPSPARAAAGQGSTKKKGTNDREGNGLSRRRSPLTDPRRRKRVLGLRNAEGLDSKI